MADSFLPGNISGSISDSDNDMLEVKDHVNQVEDHVDHVNHVNRVAAKVWGEGLSDVEGKHEFNELGARPRPKLTIENENENENGQLTTAKPSQAYETVKVEGSIVRMKWSNHINWELKKNKAVERRLKDKYLNANDSHIIQDYKFELNTDTGNHEEVPCNLLFKYAPGIAFEELIVIVPDLSPHKQSTF